jgi:hypothetical protein
VLVVIAAKNQLRTWNNQDGIFLVIDVLGDKAIIADGKHRKYVDIEVINSRSKITDLVKTGDLRFWSVSTTNSIHAFMIVSVRADKRGGIFCDILDESKLYVISLGSLLLASELLNAQ